MKRSTGEIYEKLSSSFEWKIKNFTSLSAKPGESYESPHFDFYNASWCLEIYPNGLNNNYSHCISLFMKKLNCQESKHTIFRKFSIKKNDGTDYASFEGEKKYSNNISKDLSMSWGFPNFSDREKFLEDINDITADDILTISCTVSWNRGVAEASSDAVNTKSKAELLEDEANNGKENDVISSADKGVIPTIIDTEKLTRDMETLFSNGRGSDVTLIVQDRKFPVHSIILGIRSPVFAAMFTHDMEEKTSGVVNIADFDPEVFHEFLLYLYTAKVEKLSLKTAVGLYSAADKYSTQELKTKCIEFMRANLSLDMFCSVVSLALQHEESSLLEATTKFFVKNLKKIIVTVEWQEFIKENPAAANELHIKASVFHVPPEE